LWWIEGVNEMAVQEQRERLLRSVDEWNQRRRQQPNLRPDLSGANLIGANLSRANLSGANFIETNLRETDLSRADLSKANLFKADLSGADLVGTDLSGADLFMANLSGTNLSGANLSRANLSGANLSGANLSKANLNEANLSGADLSRTDLSVAYLSGANLSKNNLSNNNLSKANLSGADLSGADLIGTDLSGTNLSRANLGGADLSGANLSGAYLSGTNLSGANLRQANLSGAYLRGVCLSKANLTEAHFFYTTFAWVDLSRVKGLETALHDGPSSVDAKSVTLPRDEYVRQHFLRNTGFSDTFIDYLSSVLNIPIEHYSLFLSYSHHDQAFVRRLYIDLQNHDVRCWFVPHNLHPATHSMRGIEEAIHLHEKLLLVLSYHVVMSDWVQHEVEAAMYKEITSGQEILFPIRLDSTVLEIDGSWARRLRQRDIADFTAWQDEKAYHQAFTTLLRHLKAAKTPTWLSES
jgi:uncharacterized protein YjbI with pentapeptide repeats